MSIEGEIMKNKTCRLIEEVMKEVKTPLHLNEISRKVNKTRYACYSAIHLEEGKTFKKIKPATYYLIGDSK